MSEISIAQYLLDRLAELRISNIFGVPGDYNLDLMDHVLQDKRFDWIGNCNELNAAYAADGYARVRGMAAVITTFGVGELSAINGIAGSYAERVPVVHIVGSPATTLTQTNAIQHHTLGNTHFSVFREIYHTFCEVAFILDDLATAASLIDDALVQCWLKKRPVYLSLPSNLVNATVQKPTTRLHLQYPNTDAGVLEKVSLLISGLICQAQSPMVLADTSVTAYGMRALLTAFLQQTQIPCATMNMSQGIFNESYPHFLGMYAGKFSSSGVEKYLETADCLICFGALRPDFHSGLLTAPLEDKTVIEIHFDHVVIDETTYQDIYFDALLPTLTKALTQYHYTNHFKRPTSKTPTTPKDIINQHDFWQRLSTFLQPQDILLADIGTPIFGLLGISLPDDITVITQPLWASIGYTLPAGLGAALADKTRRTLIIIGDGALQTTAQEFSSIMRHGLNTMVFILDNNGYSIERAIHEPDLDYNDIHPWDYQTLPHVFGKNVYTALINTCAELEKELTHSHTITDKVCVLQIKLHPNDYPDVLLSLRRAVIK